MLAQVKGILVSYYLYLLVDTRLNSSLGSENYLWPWEPSLATPSRNGVASCKGECMTNWPYVEANRLCTSSNVLRESWMGPLSVKASETLWRAIWSAKVVSLS